MLTTRVRPASSGSRGQDRVTWGPATNSLRAESPALDPEGTSYARVHAIRGPKRARPTFVSCTQLLATAGFRMNGIVPLCNDAMIIEAIPA